MTLFRIKFNGVFILNKTCSYLYCKNAQLTFFIICCSFKMALKCRIKMASLTCEDNVLNLVLNSWISSFVIWLQEQKQQVLTNIFILHGDKFEISIEKLFFYQLFIIHMIYKSYNRTTLIVVWGLAVGIKLQMSKHEYQKMQMYKLWFKLTLGAWAQREVLLWALHQWLPASASPRIGKIQNGGGWLG